MTIDLTAGKPSRVLLRFALPMIFSVLLQQLYVLVDLFVVGNFTATPETAIAAVAAASSVTAIYTAVAVGFNTGCSVLIARFFGGKQYRQMHTAVRTAWLGAGLIAVVLTVLGFVFCEPLLNLIDTPASAMDSAVSYLQIYTASLLFVFLYNISNGICTALGDSSTPLYFLAASSVGNVLLDLLFVGVFHWGVQGAAWATFIAQAASACVLFGLLRYRINRFEGEDAPWVQPAILGELASLSVPTVLQQSFIAVGNFLIQKVIDGLGSEATIAGFSTALKVNGFATACFVTVSAAIAAYTAQNVGAGQEARVKQGFTSGTKMLYLLMFPIVLLFMIFAPFFIKLFLNTDDPAIMDVAVDAGSAFLRFVAPFYLVIAVKIATDGIMRGYGAMKFFIISTIADLVIRVVLCYLLSALGMGVYAIPTAWAVGWTTASLLAGLFYKMRVWERPGKRERSPS